MSMYNVFAFFTKKIMNIFIFIERSQWKYSFKRCKIFFYSQKNPPARNRMNLLRRTTLSSCVELLVVQSLLLVTPGNTFTRPSHAELSSTHSLPPECSSKWPQTDGDGCMPSPQVIELFTSNYPLSNGRF